MLRSRSPTAGTKCAGRASSGGTAYLRAASRLSSTHSRSDGAEDLFGWTSLDGRSEGRVQQVLDGALSVQIICATASRRVGAEEGCHFVILLCVLYYPHRSHLHDTRMHAQLVCTSRFVTPRRAFAGLTQRPNKALLNDTRRRSVKHWPCTGPEIISVALLVCTRLRT